MTTAVHAHHWIIAPANGPVSKGRCKTCGAERQFKNTLLKDREGYDWAAHRQIDMMLSERWAEIQWKARHE